MGQTERVYWTRPPKRRQYGFTLIELLVVVAIMSILATVGLPLTELMQRRTKEEELRRSLREIRSAIDAYKRLTDQGYIVSGVDSSGYPPTLEILVEGVSDARALRGTKIYLLRKLPRDPFAERPDMPPAETWALRSYASSPENPSPGKDVFDVHSKSKGIGLDGSAYRTW